MYQIMVNVFVHFIKCKSKDDGRMRMLLSAAIIQLCHDVEKYLKKY